MNIDVRVIPSLPDLYIQLAATLILFLVMRYFLIKPVKKLLNERKSFIEEGVKNSEDAKLAIENSNEIYEKKLLEAKKESSEIISQARIYGEEIKNKALEDSKELTKQELEANKKVIEAEREKTLKSMNDEISEMVIAAAEKVLREKIGSETDKNMVKSFIEDLEESNE